MNKEKEALKIIFEFLEKKENKIPKGKGSFRWRLSFNEPFTKEDLVQNGNLDLSHSNIVSFPKELNGLYVKGNLRLPNCTSLTSLPNDLKVGGFLNLTNCTSLTSLPNDLKVDGDFWLTNCTSLTSLPNDLKVGGYLNLRNNTNLTSLPNDLKVASNLYIKNTIFAKMTDEKIRAMIPNGYIKGQIIR